MDHLAFEQGQVDFGIGDSHAIAALIKLDDVAVQHCKVGLIAPAYGF